MQKPEYSTIRLTKETMDELWRLKRNRERLSDVVDKALKFYLEHHKQ